MADSEAEIGSCWRVVRNTEEPMFAKPSPYLNLESISFGLNAMATECPRHFADFLNGRADLISGDAFF